MKYLGRLLWIAGVIAAVASVAGTCLVLASRSGDTRTTEPARPSIAAVACFGYVDVESGVLHLSPTVPGRVVEVGVHVNGSVRANDVLLRLEDTSARADVEAAEGAVQAAELQLADARKTPEQQRYLLQQQQAALDAAQHQLESARQAHTRRQQLIHDGNIPPAEVTAAEENIKRLESARDVEQAKLNALKLRDPGQDIKKAEAELRMRRALLAKARFALEQHTLRAPRDGTILRVVTQQGDLIGPQSPQPALLFLPEEPRLVRAEIPQEFAAGVEPGLTVVLRDDSRAQTSWRGKVRLLSDWYSHRRSIWQDPMQYNDVRTLECLIDLDPGQPPLRIGQRLLVQIVGKNHE